LLTEEELLEQDQKAQAAVFSLVFWFFPWQFVMGGFVFAQKLDELLRRGTPADLVAANDLMKIMASYVRFFFCCWPFLTKDLNNWKCNAGL